jgi:hypothetical protein
LGIGTSTPASVVEINHNPTGINDTTGLILNNGSLGSTLKSIIFNSGTTERGTFGVHNGSGEFRWGISSGGYFPTIYANGSERLRINTTGNVLINTTTDAGFRLDVNGTARVQGQFTASSVINVVSGSTTLDRDGVFLRMHGTSGIKLTTWNAGYVDALTVQATTGNIGIGTSTPAYKLHVVGSAGFDNGASGDSITLLNDGFIKSSLIRFRGFSTQFVIQDNSYNTKFAVSTSGSLSYFNTGGNVAIGTTTDAGFRLDVNGTARVANSLDINNNNGIAIARVNANLTVASGGASPFSIIDFKAPPAINGTVGLPSGRIVSGFDNTVYAGTRVTIQNATGPSTYVDVLSVYGTSVGIGILNPSSSALLDLTSTTKGFLPPRMTTTQKNAIASPATGLMVYDTTLNLISVYNGTTWITL